MGIKLWAQSNEYQVPNSILAGDDADAVQEDESLRGLLQWSYGDELQSFVVKQAFVYHGLHFKDPSAQIDSKTTFGAWTSRFEGHRDFGSGLNLQYGINHLYEYAGEENFGIDPPTRNTTAFFSSLRYDLQPTTKLVLNVRQETADGIWAPLAPSLGIEHQIDRFFLLKGNISRNYRLPTFNDLFWQGAGGVGNPSLQPESAWGGEAGLHFSHKSLSIQVTAYSQSVDNWVLWRPNSTGEWSPDNVKKVWSRGLESDASYQMKMGAMDLKLISSYRLTKTTNEEVTQNFSLEQGKQLSYTPEHEYVQQAIVGYSSFELLLRYNYVGQQYTEGENKSVFALDSYQLLDASLQYNTQYKKMSASIFFKADNLFDTAYENRRGFPMYGRNFSIGANLKFKRNNT